MALKSETMERYEIYLLKSIFTRKLGLMKHDPIDAELSERIKCIFHENLMKRKHSEIRPGDARLFHFQDLMERQDSEKFFERHLHYCERQKIPPPRYMTLMVNHTWKERGSLGSGGGWHRDSGWSPQYKTFTYLCDVNESTGPLCINDHQNYVRSLIKNPRTRLQIAHKLGPSPKVIDIKITGEEGMSFSCCTNFAHRGMPVEHGSRYMITVYAWDRLPPRPFRNYFRS